ncbi:MAG TPA: carboxylesterase family protein [Bryobacteraceae bacterium]|nr:carboxylesterase family protein [Bryobacteraceae bacterium]
MTHNPMNRRSFLSAAGGALAAASAAKAGATVVAKTTSGEVRGARTGDVILFKGIPYAGSPAGENRFKAPPRLKPWTGVRDALVYGAQAIQPPDPGWPKEWKTAASSEECLFLNIWTQGVADGRKRPVMFYSHGGGFATGNGGAEVWPQYLNHDGTALAKNYDVVVVTHNHRLGLLGFLYLGDLLGEEYAASGAAGMLDIVAALEWVRDNIAAFGGDPDNVMIWGESGGGAKTATLTAMPRAQGFYHKASVESGPTLRLTPRDAATESTRKVLSKLGRGEKQARDLIQVPAEQLRALQEQMTGTNPMRFGPVVDGQYIPHHPYDPVAPAMSAKIPMIIGTNKDETIMFFQRGSLEVFSLDEAGMRKRLHATLGDRTDRIVDVYHHSRPNASPADIYIAITTAQFMWNNAITMAERKVALQAAPVYMYIFAYESEVPVSPTVHYPQKAAHAMEMAFKFDHPDNNPDAGKRPERYKAAKNMSAAWAAFARTSNPSHPGIPKWPAYTLTERATMILDAECKVVDDPYREERLAWKS